MIRRSVDDLLRRLAQLEIVTRRGLADSKSIVGSASSNVPAVQQPKEKAVAVGGGKKKKAKDTIPRDEKGFPTILMGIMKPDDPLVLQGYGTGKTAIRLDWWNNNQRWHYWAAWRQLKDVNRRKMTVEHAQDRVRMHTMMDNNILPVGFRESVESELKQMPHRHKWEATHGYCQITARRRGRVLRYRISRIIFRDLADHGKLSGVTRSFF